MDFDFFVNHILKGITAQIKTLRHNTINDYTIDTFYIPNYGLETIIWKGQVGTIITVARYNTEEEALEGHKDWVYACSLNPTKAWSVRYNEYIEL